LSARSALLAASLGAAALAAQAGSAASRFCDHSASLSAQQQDLVLLLAAAVRQELEASGQSLALISRSGLDLARFGARYSHAGISLKASANGPWSVRQLYYACDEGRPRLYDQGLAGFLLGTDKPSIGYVSIVLLPREAATALEATALDKARALRLLAATYSANAYAFSPRYQNCNQWLMELLASAWGGLADGEDLRERAQRWLAEQGYAPQPVELGSHWLMFAAGFVPLVHLDDHPEVDRFALRFRTSLPASIEAFVRRQVAGAERIELCHNSEHIVVHRGWAPLADGCRPGPGDRVLRFEAAAGPTGS
jgi:hypothetical protein